MPASINLRDSLLAALSTLPGVREFHLHVLVSAPRKNASLYPYARPRPRAYLHDILVLCSEQENPDAPRILVTAIEAKVYRIPTTSSAVFYVSKVDSTGQNTGKSPTGTLVRALLSFYAHPATRPIEADNLWIQLFARAQGQYLFPNSAEYAGKQPLSDAKLCSWWKHILTQTIGEVEAKAAERITTEAFYILPGYSEADAEDLMRVASSSAAGVQNGKTWCYGHPYSHQGIQYPCPQGESGDNLGTFIPWFDDDPKARFLDEIALITSTTEGIKSPAKKRPRTESQSDSLGSSNSDADKSTRSGKEDRPMGELKKVSRDEFWERMSFRQECVAGAVTGFFTAIFCATAAGSARSLAPPLAPQPGQVGAQIIKRIMTVLLTGVEFSSREKGTRATETVEGAIRGLCEGLGSAPGPGSPPALPGPPRTPPRRGRTLPEVSPNVFPEPVASVETYESHIYGSARVSRTCAEGSGAKPAAAVVTVLTARRKKKRRE